MFLALLVAGCSPVERTSFLLVTLDTTRADRLSAYGYGRPTTPVLEELVEQGMRFERAYSSAPLTIPSHATMLTGQFPPTHGVRDNGDFVLSEDAVLLSERFSDAGYATAAFTAAFPTQARWGFDQGFDVYHDPLERLPTQLDWSDQRTADQVVDDALATLPGLRTDGRPLFVWVHMFDPHWPYEPPEPYASEHEGRPYDGEIAFADAQLGRLLEWWDAELERSVVMVTADHGEGMGDGGERTHGFLLHDGTIRVPMIARGHGVPQGEVSEDPVSHVDLAPTMLAIAGLPTDERLVGRDMRQGGSDQVYSEATTGQFNLGLSSLTSLTDERGRFTEGGWQGWYPVKRNRVAVVPQETTDLPILAERMEELRTRLGDHQAPVTSLQPEELQQLQALGYIGGDPLAESGPVDPRDVIDLMPLTWAARRAMGQGELERAEQMIARLEARLPGTFGVDLLSAQLLRTQGEVTEAIERYTDLYLRSPGGTVSLHLASMYASSGDWEAAEDWFRTTLEHQANSPEAMAGLVRCALARGEPVQAEMLADQYLEIYPDHAELVLLAVRVKIDLGQPGPQLLDAARQALERLSRSAWAYTQVSHVAWQTGEAELAIELAQEALRIDPMGWGARVELARMLLEVGRAAEASRVLAPAVRSAPEFTELQQLYGQALAAVQAQVAESGPADGP